MSCEVVDPDLVHYPKIVVAPDAEIPPGVTPHLGHNGEFCYLEKGSVVLDRYRPDRAVLLCLEAAETALRKAIKGDLDIDVAEEFGAYWAQGLVYANLPDLPKNSIARIVWRKIAPEPKAAKTIFLIGDGGLPAVLDGEKRRGKEARDEGETCHVLTTDKRFTARLRDPKWPPTTLEDFLDWLGDYIGDVEQAWEKICRTGIESHWWIALKAPNGMFLARIELPPAYQKQEFLRGRRDVLSRTLRRGRIKVPVTRYLGKPIDGEFVFGRNLHGMKNLQNKKILLIGCGTIGGFLAHQLALSGAGYGESAVLTLIDNDVLSPSNLGRHYLGIRYLGQNKAAACKTELEASVPYLNIRAIGEDALDCFGQLEKHDLVIDATGDDAFTIALNDFAVGQRRLNPKFPPVLHVWIAANGGAGVALFCDSMEQGCYKCLQPNLFGLPRTTITKDERVTVRNQSCGDAPYTPFPVSSSSQAASLALEMALDWANDRIGRRHRIRTYNDRTAFIREDKNVAPHKDCPACRPTSP